MHTHKRRPPPELVAMFDEADKARADFQRFYYSMKRAFNAAEKARARLLRVEKRIEKWLQAQAAATA